MVNAAFVAQSYTDTHRKFQKLEGFAGINTTQLLEVPKKVMVNSDQEAQTVADKQMKQKVSLLATVLENAGPVQQSATSLWSGKTKRRPSLCRDQ